jgi:polar amino acid transport system substrate-binding protein
VEKSRIVSAATPSELIQKLQAGEIDLWAYPEYTGTYYMDQETGDSHLFTVVYRLSETGIYYALSQDIPDSYVESLQNSLDALQSGGDDCGTGQYEKILASYVPENTPTD